MDVGSYDITITYDEEINQKPHAQKMNNILLIFCIYIMLVS